MLEGKESNWLDRQAKREARTDGISISDRVGQVAAAAVMLAVLLFFVAHQVWSTGFFTSEFGLAGAFLVFAPISVGIAVALSRFGVGRKNVLRPFETGWTVFGLISFVWFLVVFPFAFSEFANVVPGFLRFLVSWVSDGVAQVVLVIAVVGTAAFAVYNALLYAFVRRELSKPALNSG